MNGFFFCKFLVLCFFSRNSILFYDLNPSLDSHILQLVNDELMFFMELILVRRTLRALNSM